ncbi:hypothetical protein HQ35_07615 [Porphyromonas cangingivalis]|uniref:Uncharacterized protein n=1 Tax=Porphyromonas cangingivalis TaxID=36874 RepID=A0A0A2EKR8_PORCN|nr:copper resistance protein NlpE [Porphyromonas cangingivalis]KGN79426.1 hypothetical protein HQ35_07615 [Porphyromonas cangingivalis]
MKKGMFLGLSLVALLTFGACTGGKKSESTENTQTEQTETVAQEKVWVGTYEGLLPSGSGEGIQNVITLNDDNTFARTMTYVSEGSTFENKGTIEWAEDGVTFTLVNEEGEKTMFLLGEGAITALTAEGTVVEGELADQYILRKK